MLATALYGRTSKDDPKRVTIEIQQKLLREWAAHDSAVRIVDEYWDDGVSGKIPLWERPEGRRLIEDANSKKIESVAVAYLDRFGRTLLDGLQAVKTLEGAGVKLVAVNDGWDARRPDCPPLYFQIRLMLAEDEHKRIGERMKSGKNRAMERDNAPPGGPLVFGYRMNESGQFVADPIEAPIVIRIFEMALQGFSNNQILKWVISQNIPAGRKFQKRLQNSEPKLVSTHIHAAWHLSKINKILRNHTYTGVRRWGNRTFPCLPLVDKQTFDEVQLICEDKSRRFGIGKKDPSRGLVSGLLRCGLCGSPFYHRATVTHRANGKADRYQMYACDAMRRKNSCKAKMLRVASVDKFVWDYIVSLLSNPERIIEEAISLDNKSVIATDDISRKEFELTECMKMIDAEVQELWGEKNKNDWPMQWIAPQLNDLSTRRNSVEKELGELAKERARLSLGREQVSTVVASLAKFRANLCSEFSAEEKYEIVKVLVAGGVVDTFGEGRKKRAKVTVEFRWNEFVSPMLPKDWSYGSWRNTTQHLFLPEICSRFTS